MCREMSARALPLSPRIAQGEGRASAASGGEGRCSRRLRQFLWAAHFSPHPPLRATFVRPSRLALGRSSPRETMPRKRASSPPLCGEKEIRGLHAAPCTSAGRGLPLSPRSARGEGRASAASEGEGRCSRRLRHSAERSLRRSSVRAESDSFAAGHALAISSACDSAMRKRSASSGANARSSRLLSKNTSSARSPKVPIRASWMRTR